ncbi:nucleotidyl transferase AbiEii/AbiGii toxin family protein [Sinomicrobium soli]|uniref:nucleotidyl transferase AbiEii/AbiGii toxin family protein n=1 Tax=Sinomicrobium sp. N-1-3-6 TaxID=2219864 RepID=UPI000DCB9D78|nr:nucleotidyl transferase AbiEii/AbiGii toxin family protein [Sinomicrobium sp. N-1-3-6]RAV28909.1 nucleotidyl transferase AbiEii/AbiGii toxin family protein [Sinomicrobium sp. N-1-3-6]
MWSNLNAEQRQQILQQVSAKTGLPTYVIEKDWWVCLVLRAVFKTRYAGSIFFKGGTSLSKAYQLIERFSEDIDLIIDRHLLGFDELDSKTKIKKLRKASGRFIITEFQKALTEQISLLGIKDHQYEIRYNDHVDDTSDPNTLEIIYESLTSNRNTYIQPRVLLEMGARSLTEPSEDRSINSYIDEQYKDLPFALPAFDVQVVIPAKTFLEKTLLLHEEFSKPTEKIRTDRLTRHLYDLEKLMNTPHGKLAIEDDELFATIVAHRKKVTPLRGLDYSRHKKGKLSIIPPDTVIKDWEQDYKTMQENMIVGESLPWRKLMERMKEIENKLNQL